MIPPRLCADLEPITARVRERPEDFVVDEVLAYEPSGAGTHSWLRLEKRGLSTFEAVRRLARALGRPERDLGYAGLKDRQAVTRQWVSIEHADEVALAELDVPGLTVLERTRHGNKCKLGHLRGNRFRLRLRGAGEGAAERARAVLARLARRGLPNAYGEQRFGRDGATPELGAMLLAERFEDFLRLWAAGACGLAAGDVAGLGPEALLERGAGRDRQVATALARWRDRDARKALRTIPRRFLSLCTAALQSRAFNAVLAARLDTLDRLLPGEQAVLHRNGALFLVTDAALEQPRCQAFELSPSGPLPGPSCARPEGEALAVEEAALRGLDLDPARFAVKAPWSWPGGRRPLRVPLAEVGLAELDGDPPGTRDLELAFFLPAGSYATQVLHELGCPTAGDHEA
ncbi:MAG: tRNA pseudouridine(13) synthase TruD [Planctomycetota bacterium]